MDIKKYTQEFLRCRSDPIYFINNYIRVPDVGEESIPLKLYPVQKELVNAIHNKHKIILLGSRQTGKTTVIEAYIVYLLIFFENYNVLHISRSMDQASTDLAEIKFMLENLPSWLRPELIPPDNATTKKLENGSIIKAQPTATEKSSSSKGRGLRAPFLWIDEAAFVHLSKLKASVFPVVSRQMLNAKMKGLPYGIVLSSTPNGVVEPGKEFYDMWMYAQQNSDDLSRDEAYYPIRIHWSDIPVYDEKWIEDRKEDEGYYRSAEGKRDFMQEFELVFLGSRDSLFPDELIEKLVKVNPINSEYITNDKHERVGPINWYSEIDPNKIYLIGVDTATGLFGEDLTAIEIVDYETLEQVGEFHKKCQVGDTKAIIDYLISKKLPKSIVIPENNGVGNDVIEFMMSDYYKQMHFLMYKYKDHKTVRPKMMYGLNTNKNRPLILDSIFEALTEDPSRVKSPDIIDEIPGIKKTSRGRYEGNHDDTVFAYGFTTYTALYLRKYLYEVISRFPKSNVSFDSYMQNQETMIMDVIRSNDPKYKHYIYEDTFEKLGKSVSDAIIKNPHIEFDIEEL